MMNDEFTGMKYIPIFFIMLLSFSSCVSQVEIDRAHCQNKAFDKKVERSINFSVPTISPEQIKATISKPIILDAREKQEFVVSHIPDARHIGYKDFSMDSLKDIAKDDQIIIYCTIGYRSEKIGERLQAEGFTNVFNLYGSIFEWVNQGNTVVDSQGLPTKRVHTYNKNWSKWLDESKAERVW